MANVKSGQTILDVVGQNFGNLEYLVAFCRDNGLSLSDALTAGQEVDINNEDLGDEYIKRKIIEKNVIFNNYQE